MCGLICWTARPDDADTLVAAVARRGPHTHGWATLNFTGWHTKGGAGPLTGSPPGLALGHSRLATSGALHGDQPPDTEWQPLTHYGIALAHNGTLPDEDQDIIDSCLLLHMPDPHDYLIRHGGRHALITIDLPHGILEATTTGQPLWLRDLPGSMVLTSVPVGEGWRPLPPQITLRKVLT